jgi:2-dehydropantoate 2-reductase
MIYGIWFKFMCNVGENMTCALLNIPFGAYIVSEAASNIRVAAMKEVKAIANAKGINLTERDMASQFETLKILPAKNIPSTRQDLNAKKKTEVDMFAGSVVKMGKELDIETPISWFFLNAISVLEEQNEGKFEFE